MVRLIKLFNGILYDGQLVAEGLADELTTRLQIGGESTLEGAILTVTTEGTPSM